VIVDKTSAVDAKAAQESAQNAGNAGDQPNARTEIAVPAMRVSPWAARTSVLPSEVVALSQPKPWFVRALPPLPLSPSARPLPARAAPPIDGQVPLSPAPYDPSADLKLIDTRGQQLEGEVNVLRRELNRLQTAKKATDAELLEQRRAIKDFEHRLDRVKTTISYQLGSSLVDSKKSWRAAIKLPGRLLKVFRSSRRLRKRTADGRDQVPASIAQSAEAIAFIKSAMTIVETGSGEQAAAWARTQNAKPSILAYTLLEIARTVGRDDPQLAAALGSEALDLYPAEQRVKALAFLLGEHGHIRKAVATLDKAVIAGANISSSEARTADNLRSLARMLDVPPAIPSERRVAAQAGNKRIAVIGRETLPFHVSTLALRLRDRAHRAQAAGWEARVITPPGYPLDIRGRSSLPGGDQQTNVAGVTYLRLKRLEQPEEIADMYLSAAAASYAAAIVTSGARAVQADGFFVQGVAAALAARSAGCALLLEYDDLLNPHDAFAAGMEHSERGQLQLGLSMIAARAADACIVHHPNILRFLEGAGVSRDRIVMAPYRFPEALPDQDAVAALARQLGLADGPVIGVVRDLCESYHTLVLADLLAALAPAVPGLKLLVVGQGRADAALRKRAADLGLKGSLVLVDKPDPALMNHYRAMIDVTVFTRHDTARAAVLSAYEVQAALAAGRAIVAYRTADAKDIIDDGVTGVLSAPGDFGELKHKVQALLDNAAERDKLGDAARQHYLSSADSKAMDEVYRVAGGTAAGGQRLG
jgi:glycosyltransferase involved in cell wall biosynthesis